MVEFYCTTSIVGNVVSYGLPSIEELFMFDFQQLSWLSWLLILISRRTL